MKLILRVEHTEHDTLIDGFIKSAIRLVEDYLHRTLTTTTYELVQDTFEREIELNRGPVKSITSVHYMSEDDTAAPIEITNTNYDLLDKVDPPLLRFRDAYSAPTIDVRPDAIRIVFVAGETTVNKIPPEYKTAIQFLVTKMYESPIDEVEPDDLTAAYAMLHPTRSFRF